MNNKIQFRAWDSKKKQFITEVPFCEYMLDSDTWDHIRDDECSMTYPANPFNTFNGRIIYTQYTGLKDKNGIEVYIGDIIKHEFPKTGKNTTTVKWTEEDHDNHPGIIIKELWGQQYGEIEVIGNIFEKPPLVTRV
jgi:uncharacterized phage protein (TIGR01671 family)